MGGQFQGYLITQDNQLMRNTQMQTILGTPYTPPTPEEMQAFVRQAHAERAQFIRSVLVAVFGRRNEPKASHETSHAAIIKHATGG